jgi:hypothetical protein
MHCLLEDDVKQAFIAHQDCLDRAALDARNSPNSRPKMWLELIADKFNSEHFNPECEVFPNLHKDFAEPIHLGLDKCMTISCCPGPFFWFSCQNAAVDFVNFYFVPRCFYFL